MRNRSIVLAICALCLTNISFAESEHHSAYAGEQHRRIKSLSAADIADPVSYTHLTLPTKA